MNNTTIDNSLSDAIKGSGKIFQTKNIVLPEKNIQTTIVATRFENGNGKNTACKRFFFKKHKFKEHEAQNAEILRKI